jgi:hypothetical protein
MATGEDLRYPGTVGGSTNWRDRLVQKYIEQVIKLMPGNPEVADVFFQVMNLLQPPTTLFQPWIMVGVAKQLMFKRSVAMTEYEFPTKKQSERPASA